MPELLTTISLGVTSLRVLAGVIGVGYSFFNKDIIGANADPMEKLQDAIFGEFVGGLASDWAEKAKDLTIEKFYKQIAKIDNDILNHDLQRAARKAQLTATRFACEACLQEIKGEQQLQGNRTIESVRSLVLVDDKTKWLTAVKNWIEAELKILPKIAPQTNVDYDEALRIFDSSLNHSPDAQQKQFINDTKDAVLAELGGHPYERFGFTIEYSESGYKLLEKKINDGWNEFTSNDEEIIQLKIFERNLLNNKKDQDKWFWLLCSFFNEEYKTNERLKAAMLKNLLLEQRRTLCALGLTIGTLNSKVTVIETKQNEILELLKRIELEHKREPFYTKYQGLEARIRVEDIITSKIQETIVGREVEFAKIDNFLRENKSGYFIITAKAGFGKSALLAKWIRQRLHQNNEDYGQRIFIAYHFFNREFFATRTLEAGFTHLLRQVCTYRAKEFPAEISRLRDIIIGMIQDQQPSEREPLVIVLDALDEAEDIIDPFIQQLPEGVFVIISARADKNELPPYLKHWSNLITVESNNGLFLNELDENDIQKWLSIGELTKYRLEKKEGIANLIYQKTNGFPLYLKYLIEDITSNLKCGQSKETIISLIEAMPKGFKQLVQKQFNESCGSLSNDWQKALQSLLSVMSVSLGAFAESDVKRLTSLTATELRGLPPKIWRWVRITSYEETNLFSFDHDLIRETFATQVFQDEKEESLRRLLNYCAKWKIHHSPYVLRHYPEHLYQQQSRQKLYEIVDNDEFLAIQEKVLSRESDIGLRNIQIALKSTMENDDAPKMAEYVLRHIHKLLALLNESPFEALKIGLEKAISQVELIYKHHIESGILWFLLLAKRLDRNNLKQEAKHTLRRLQNQNPPKFKNHELKKLAILFLSDLAGDYEDEVIALQNIILDDDSRVEFVASLLSLRLKSFSFTRNLKISRRIIELIRDSYSRAESLCFIVKAQAEIGQTEEAKQTAEEITYEDEYFKSLCFIVKAQAETGQIEEAKQTAQGITDKWQRTEALTDIAISQTQANRFNDAVQTLREIENQWHLIQALIDIAKIQSKVGQFDAAKQTFAQAKRIGQEISEKEDYTEKLIFIAHAQALNGQDDEAKHTFAQARQIAQGTNNKYTCDEALYQIATSQAKVYYIDDAKQTAQKITSEQRRNAALNYISVTVTHRGITEETNTVRTHIQHLFDVANSQSLLGQSSDAEETFAQIIWAIRNDLYEPYLYETLTFVAHAQALNGQDDEAKRTFAQARQTLQEITIERQRTEALSFITKAQAEAGQIEDAKQIVREILDESNRNEVLGQIVKVQAEAGQIEEAKQTTQEMTIEDIKSQWYCIQALTDIAKAKAKTGQIDDVKQLAQEILDEEDYAQTLSLFAQVQAEGGQVNDARQTVQEINDEYQRVQALCFIAHAQALNGQDDEAKRTFAQARQTLLKISDVYIRTLAWSIFANSLAEAGQIEDAKQIVREILDESNRNEVLGQIVKVQAEAGQIEEAKQTTQEMTIEDINPEEINNKPYHIQALIDIARAQAKIGQMENAKQTFALAKQRAQKINVEFHLAHVLYFIAEGEALAGLSTSLETASLSLFFKNKLLPQIAAVCISEENTDLFKQFLPPASYYLDSAYKMVGLLAKLYPQQSMKVAKVLKKYREASEI